MQFHGNDLVVDIVFGFLVSIILMVAAVAIPLTIKRRRMQPISSRPLVIHVASQVLLLLYAVHLCFQRMNSHRWPCALNVVFGYGLILLVLNLYLLRLWFVWFAYKITHDKVQARSLLSNNVSSLWYLRHSHYSSSKFLTRMYFGMTTPTLLLLFSVFLYDPHVFSQTTDVCPAIGTMVWFWMFLVVLYYGVCIFVATKFGEVQDGFYLKKELRLIGICSLCGSISWFVVLWFPMNASIFPFSTLILYLAVSFAFFVSTLLPIYKSYNITTRRQKGKKTGNISLSRQSARSNSPGQDLVMLLSSGEGEALFKEHLIREFSVENLLFYNDAVGFSDTFEKNRKEAKKRAQEIYGNYITDDADLQVNLDFKVVVSIENELEGVITASIFDSARDAIFNLMATDSLSRFDWDRVSFLQPESPSNFHDV